MTNPLHGAIEPRKPFALPLPSHVERSSGDWALRCIDLARLALKRGVRGNARLCIKAAISFARDVESDDLRHLLAAEISAVRGEIARTIKQDLTVAPPKSAPGCSSPTPAPALCTHYWDGWSPEQIFDSPSPLAQGADSCTVALPDSGLSPLCRSLELKAVA